MEFDYLVNNSHKYGLSLNLLLEFFHLHNLRVVDHHFTFVGIMFEMKLKLEFLNYSNLNFDQMVQFFSYVNVYTVNFAQG